MERFGEQTAQRRKLWRNLGRAQTLREMWVYLSAERTKAKQLIKKAQREAQQGVRGQCSRNVLPWKSRVGSEPRQTPTCTPKIVRLGLGAQQKEDWEEYRKRLRKEDQVTDWIWAKIREAHEKAARTHMERVSVVQEIILKVYGLSLR